MKAIEDFIKKETSSGIILMFVTALALILANSPLSHLYASFLETKVGLQFGSFMMFKPLILWINDGLMTIFFLLIGLEVKRELVEGHLSTPSQITLPVFSALGGMIAPALVFVYFNYYNGEMLKGWAIPTATDIAFALGVLSLLGKRVPASLKIFLMALAIIDDLGAIMIIALFYTHKLSMLSVAFAGIFFVALLILNRLRISWKTPYGILGILLWVSVLKSGVHATLAGVIIGFCVPLYAKNKHNETVSPSKEMEKDLHYWVAFFTLPLFAFVNAGISLSEVSFSAIFSPLSLGIILGLFLGKQLGVFLASWLVIKLGLAALPRNSTWQTLYGVSILTGIGFTMSLFIESLAFQHDTLSTPVSKLAILLGSGLSTLVGYVVIKFFSQNEEESQEFDTE